MNSRYGMSSSLSDPKLNLFSCNNAIKDTSNSLLERNAHLMNSKVFDKMREDYCRFKTLFNANKDRNDYLNPVSAFKIKEKAPLDCLNREMLNLSRLRHYSRDVDSLQPKINKGCLKSYFDYQLEKSKEAQTIDCSPRQGLREGKEMKENLICFDKNAKGEVVRRPKGFFDYSPKIKEFNRESNDAPELFQIILKEREKRKEMMPYDQEETITLLSRNKNWITVTPRSKNRRKPLESIKVKNDEPSPVLPQWLRPKFLQKLVPDTMKKVDYTSIRSRKRTMQLVDIDNLTNNPSNRSIFSIGDFRHDLPFKHDCDIHQSNISLKPKEFLHWDDGRMYDFKKKKDYI